jgi:hypothetical protein
MNQPITPPTVDPRQAAVSRSWALACLVFIGCSDHTATDDDGSETSTTDADTSTTATDSSDIDSPDAPPVLELSFSSIKQFDFSWAPVVEAQWYQLLESVDGDEPFVQLGGDIVGESISITMPLHFRKHASYKLRACNADGCWESASVDVVSNLAEAVGYFKASNTGSEDWFGEPMALSGDGNTLVVGAIGEDSNATGVDGDQANNSLQDVGAVYVFVRNGTVWSQQAYLKPSSLNSDAPPFGMKLTLSDDGNTLAVAAASTGIYMFVRDGAVWSQQAFNTGACDLFGRSVGLSGDGSTLAVGYGIDGDPSDGSAPCAGAVHVFARNADVWSQPVYVKASNTEWGDCFGCSVALSGNGDTMVVGANGEDSSATGIDGDQADNSAYEAGAAYVFVRNGGVWSQQAYVKASNTEEYDSFGADVALSDDGDTIAVFSDEHTLTVYIGLETIEYYEAGAAYVFARNGGVWSQQASIGVPWTYEGGSLGQSVALSSNGDTMAIGAHGDSSDAGAVYVYVHNGDAWSWRTDVKASNTSMGYMFGGSVALSNDGNTMAVGSIGEQSSATGIGGDQSDDSFGHAGAVYLY